ASDPFLEMAAKPAADLTDAERVFAIQYLFQANVTHLIGRYPRFIELFEKYSAYQHNPELAARHFSISDITDLQVLSQLAWFDEFFLSDEPIAALVTKGKGFDAADQKLVIAKQREIM